MALDAPPTAHCRCCSHRHVELAFHWQIMKPNLQPLMPGEEHCSDNIKCHPDRETAFSIVPKKGVLEAHSDHEFILSFSPHEVSDELISFLCVPTPVFLKAPETTAGPDEAPGHHAEYSTQLRG